MRSGVSITVSAGDRARLEALVAGRKTPQKHIWRARIVLLTVDGHGTMGIARSVAKSKPTVWRWQRRFMEDDVAGLLHDKTRPPGIPPLSPETVELVVRLTLQEPPAGRSHWTSTAMAAAVGISASSVLRIWKAHGLAPHKLKTFKLSNDPRFAEKLHDIVGLYRDPPDHAIVLSIDEKSQIQALDRTQPGLPLKPGRCGTMTHDYKRNGTATPLAALDVAEGKVIGQCMTRHRHQEFTRFLNTVNRSTPKHRDVHLIVDNYATHKHPKIRAWLQRHRRFHVHFTPTGCSWLNAVETFFSKLTRHRLKRRVFRSVAELCEAINRYVEAHNESPKPLVWTADPDRIIEKVVRGKQALEANH